MDGDKNILHRKWTLWFDDINLHKSFEDATNYIKWKNNIDQVCTFNSIQDFWKLYNNVLELDELSLKNAYYLFMDGIKPYKYDLNNLDGIKLVFTIYRTPENLNNSNNINDIWLHCILHIIGENIKYSNYINGLSIKKNTCYYELSIWIKKYDEKSYYSLYDLFYDLVSKYYEVDQGFSLNIVYN